MQYKLYQRRFCKAFVKRSNTVPQYDYFLKYLTKRVAIPISFVHIAIYDVLDNNGMNKLIKRIYKLKKSKKYNVDTHYLYHKFRTSNYVNSNMTGIQVGRIANIDFNNDKWLKSIDISYTYGNTSEVIVQYTFSFKKIISSFCQIHNFILDNIMKVKKPFFFHTYSQMKVMKEANCKELFQLDEIYFADILQGMVCELFGSQYGVKYKLPIEYAVRLRRYSKKTANRLRSVFLSPCYQKGKSHLVINTLNYDRYEFVHLVPGRYLPSPVLLRYFSDFSSEAYFHAFGKIELKELEYRMRKYLNYRKTYISAKDLKWFASKIRYIDEQEEKIKAVLRDDSTESGHFLLGWRLYIRGEVQKGDFINYPERSDYFKKLYKQNVEYLNTIAAVQNNTVVVVLTVLSLIASVIGIFTGIFAG